MQINRNQVLSSNVNVNGNGNSVNLANSNINATGTGPGGLNNRPPDFRPPESTRYRPVRPTTKLHQHSNLVSC